MLSCNHCSSGKGIIIILKVCICSFGYPAQNVHAPCCYLWLPRLYDIFAHYLIKGKFSEKKVFELKKCVLIFSTIWFK